jgi:cell division protein FtsX
MNPRISSGLKTAVVAGLALLAIGAAAGYAANRFGKPKSVIHVVTLYYKDGTTDEQKKAVLAAIEKMAAELPGVKNVWLKSTKVQGAYMEKVTENKEKPAEVSYKAHPFTDAFVVEFEDQAAFERYADHPAHKAFEEVYIPVRGRSSTHDITN